MAIRKERRLSPLKDKAFKKKEAKHIEKGGERVDIDRSYEAGVDPQEDQLNRIPKDTEDKQNVNKDDRLK